MEALAQKATFNGKIYWFWESQFKVASNHFGPFVNRNHFAGWMLLALCLGSGYLGGRITLAGSRLKNSVRECLLWIGSPEASGILMTPTGLAVMAVSLVWTLSRSGMAAGCIALSILAAAGLGASGRGWRRDHRDNHHRARHRRRCDLERAGYGRSLVRRHADAGMALCVMGRYRRSR